MTWSLSASGHHGSNDWRAEEFELLRRLVAATEGDTTITSSFSFNGNHVQATSVADAKAKLAAYDEEA